MVNGGLLCFNQPSFLTGKPCRFLQQRELPDGTATAAFKVCCSAVSSQDSQLKVNRRSANYQPPIWNYEDLHSLSTHEAPNDKDERRAKEMEEELKFIINNNNNEKGGMMLSTMLELIDDIQRLGLGYLFQNEIKGALNRVLSWQGDDVNADKELHVVALRFRLLRQHGYHVSQDVFKTFQDSEGKFMEILGEDVKGMLSLYEAAYFGLEGEDNIILDDALTFSRSHLNQLITKVDHPAMSELISHSLELPWHYKMRRMGARQYIEAYGKLEDSNSMLLELAKLDFNRVQSIYQEDIRNVSSWWNKEIELAKKLKFARDRLVECFMWSVGIVPDPKYSNCRRGLTKMAAFITTIDDIYDVYGTLDELENFTNTVERWDINALNDLPDYMKLSFLALYNTVNEMAYDILKHHGQIVIPYLKKAWADLCKSFLQEAKWIYNKDIPTFEEYLDNSWRSSSGELLLVYSYFLSSENITKEAVESLENYHNLLRWPSTIFRLGNDLATSKAELERGETASSVLCYMRETGSSEEIARQHLRNMIDSCWKKMNEERLNNDQQHPFPEYFVETACDLARLVHWLYQYGDGHGAPDDRAKKNVLSLVAEPISLT